MNHKLMQTLRIEAHNAQCAGSTYTARVLRDAIAEIESLAQELTETRRHVIDLENMLDGDIE
jgi:hypothetical protein